MKELAGKVALVTGAGTGIGRAIALSLAAGGAIVAVTDLAEDRARLVAEEIGVAGGDARALGLDVTDRRDIEAASTEVVRASGRLDVWVNNAGVSSMRAFLELTEDDWRTNMDVNAKGAFLCSQVAARQMIAQPADPETGLRGRIIVVASMAGKRGNAPYLAHYVASKFAVVGLTQAMAGELAPHRITVNAVCPGYVATSMQDREIEWEAALRRTSPAEVRRSYVNDTPLGRLETPDDVAGVVRFLAGPAASFITGESIQVNGGAWMD
jgi:meso-butanediol dehydrogenase / (S,S)-butanediol dehydrogenase / diacetyl reductase